MLRSCSSVTNSAARSYVAKINKYVDKTKPWDHAFTVQFNSHLSFSTDSRKHCVTGVAYFCLVTQLHILSSCFSCLEIVYSVVWKSFILECHRALCTLFQIQICLIHLTRENHLPLEASGRGHFFPIKHFNHYDCDCHQCLLVCVIFLLIALG